MTTPAPAPTIPTRMRAVVARAYGFADVLATDEVPVPTPKAKEVLVRVEGSSLNALDWHFLTGTPYLLRLAYGLRTPRRKVPGADVAGTIVQTGAKVTHLKPGDAVFGECLGGGLEFGQWVDFLDQADCERFGAADLFGSQDHVECLVASDTAGESGGAAPGGNCAEVQLGQPDLGAGFGSETEVACQREFEPAAKAVTEQGGDRWFAHRLDLGEHP